MAQESVNANHPAQLKLPSRSVAALTDELATLLEAHIELDRALSIMGDASNHEHEQKLLRSLHERVRQGADFSVALADYPHLFSATYINLIRAGEATGLLREVVVRLASHLNAMATLKDKVISALIYPGILTVVSGLSIIGVIAFVLPEFNDIFAEMDATLPTLTKIVMAVAEFIRAWWWIAMIVLVFMIFYLRSRYRDPSGRVNIDQWLLKQPLIGPFIKQWETARFARTLSVLISNGVPLSESISIAADVVGNRAIAETMHVAAGDLRLGGSLSARLLADEVIPHQAAHMLQVGEQSGELPSMLVKVASMYDRRVAASLEKGLALVEPILILGLALVISIIILAILLAILGLNDLPI